MKNIVSISLGNARNNFDFQASFMGKTLRVRRLGTDGSVSKAVTLLRQWEPRADALGLGVARDSYSVAGKRYVDADSIALKSAVQRVAVTTGARLQDILQEWAVRHVQTSLPQFFNHARVLFWSGKAQYRLVLSLSEYTQNLQFADPIVQHGVPKLLHGVHELELYTRGADLVAGWVPDIATDNRAVRLWADHVLQGALQECTVLVAMPHEVDAVPPQHLTGKVVVSCGVNAERERAWGDLGVHTSVDAAPVLH